MEYEKLFFSRSDLARQEVTNNASACEAKSVHPLVPGAHANERSRMAGLYFGEVRGRQSGSYPDWLPAARKCLSNAETGKLVPAPKFPVTRLTIQVKFAGEKCRNPTAHWAIRLAL